MPKPTISFLSAMGTVNKLIFFVAAASLLLKIVILSLLRPTLGIQRFFQAVFSAVSRVLQSPLNFLLQSFRKDDGLSPNNYMLETDQKVLSIRE